MSDSDKKSSAVLIGHKGVKYGLQKRKPGTAPKPAAFDDASSEDDDVDAQVKKQQEQNTRASKVAAARAAAVAEDSTVYEYDSVYDDMQRGREASKRQEVQERKPKYIQALMQKAEIRKKEQDLAYERRLLKERKKDDHLYEEKEAFLTSAYKQKLIDDKYWMARETMLDVVEEREDVTKKSDLTGFYQNLVTKNVAFASNRLAEEEEKAEPAPEPEIEAFPPPPATTVGTSAKEAPKVEDVAPNAHTVDAGSQETRRIEEEEPAKDSRKRRNDATSLASARERYLARKRAAHGT